MIAAGRTLFGGFNHPREMYWEGYQKAVVDIGKEVYDVNLMAMTFEEKLALAEALQVEYPNLESWFAHDGHLHMVGELKAMEGLATLFKEN